MLSTVDSLFGGVFMVSDLSALSLVERRWSHARSLALNCYRMLFANFLPFESGRGFV